MINYVIDANVALKWYIPEPIPPMQSLSGKKKKNATYALPTLFF